MQLNPVHDLIWWYFVGYCFFGYVVFGRLPAIIARILGTIVGALIGFAVSILYHWYYKM